MEEGRAQFQFTHPRGVRPEGVQYSSPKSRRFNSRTRKGCDEMSCLSSSLNRKFQFTHPRGVRRTPRERTIGRIRFNSRTREGCDPSRCCSRRPSSSFNSRTREGWDIYLLLNANYEDKFQFTHPRGVRHLRNNVISGEAMFQFTHPRGVRRSAVLRDRSLRRVSIHAPARGATCT